MKHVLSYEIEIDPVPGELHGFKANLDLTIHIPLSIGGSLKAEKNENNEKKAAYEKKKKEVVEFILEKSRDAIDDDIRAEIRDLAKDAEREMKVELDKKFSDFEEEIENEDRADARRKLESKWIKEIVKYFDNSLQSELENRLSEKNLAALAGKHYDKLIKDAKSKFKLDAEKGKSEIRRKILVKGGFQVGANLLTLTAATLTLADSNQEDDEEPGMSTKQKVMIGVSALGFVKTLYDVTKDLAQLTSEWDDAEAGLKRLVACYDTVKSKTEGASQYAQLHRDAREYQRLIEQYDANDPESQVSEDDYNDYVQKYNSIRNTKTFKDGMQHFTDSWSDLKKAQKTVKMHFIENSQLLRKRRKEFKSSTKGFTPDVVSQIKNGKSLYRDLHSLAQSMETLSKTTDKLMEALLESDKLLQTKGWQDSLPEKVETMWSRLGKAVGAITYIFDKYRTDIGKVNDGMSTALMRGSNLA